MLRGRFGPHLGRVVSSVEVLSLGFLGNGVIDRLLTQRGEGSWKEEASVEQFVSTFATMENDLSNESRDALEARCRTYEQTIAELRNKEEEDQNLRDRIAALEKEKKDFQAKGDDDAKRLRNEVSRLLDEKEELNQQLANVMNKRSTESTLERVSSLFNKADQAIQELETTITLLKQNTANPHETLLSTLETASLVHGQIKVSLMLLELKLRNNLEQMPEYRGNIQDELREAMARVEQTAESQWNQVQERAVAEKRLVMTSLETKVQELQELRARVAEAERVRLSETVLQRLNHEVVQAAACLRRKNEAIAYWKGTSEEQERRGHELEELISRLEEEKEDTEEDIEMAVARKLAREEVGTS